MKPSDVLAIMSSCRHVLYASPSSDSSARTIYGNLNWPTTVVGGNEYFLTIKNWKIDRGRFFTHGEVRSAAKVCIIGTQVEQNLFLPGEDSLGATIRINKIPFQVIGIQETRGAGINSDQDDVIYIPFTTMMQRINKRNYITQMMVAATSKDSMAIAKDEIKDLLRQRHHILSGDDDDFDIITQDEILKMIGDLIKTMTILLGTVASISLVVGGIGIMNIMLVSVTERVREIGIRMALGAKRKDILNQFLVEAVTQSVIGGVLGVGFGYGASAIVKSFTGWFINISPFSIILSLSFACIVGVFFGFYPAWQASRLDPIQALRHE
jgi:putative ABC transport system permease protein